MKFGMFFVGEYLGITLISAFIATLFFGGWLGPNFLHPIVWFILKNICLHLFFHFAPRLPSTSALRSTYGLRMEGDASTGIVESDCHRWNYTSSWLER